MIGYAMRMALALPLMALGGCVGATSEPAAGIPAAKLETVAWSLGPCFGFCPVYTVAVSPAGTVTVDGERHTASLGRKTREGGADAVRAVASALAAYRPTTGTSLQTICDQRISDQSTLRITWTAADGTVTTLNHDKGCRSARNTALVDAIQALPARLGIEPWVRQTTRPGAERG